MHLLAWWKQFEHAVRDLLPVDLGETPVYFRRPSDLPGDGSEEFEVSYAFAWTSTLCDLWLQPYLEAEGAWQGRGFAAVLSDHTEGYWQGYGRWDTDPILATLLHEACHYFDDADHETRQLDRLQIVGTEFETHRQLCSLIVGVQATPEYKPKPPWFGHGPDFLRVLAHVVHRVQRRVHRRSDLAELLADPVDYGLAPAGDYFRALGSEPQDNLHRPIVDVMRQPDPASFREFADADVARATEAWQRATAEARQPAEAAA